jgi:peptide-methionine (R)-S-oxide reductase
MTSRSVPRRSLAGFALGFALTALVASAIGAASAATAASASAPAKVVKIVKSDAEWRKALTAEQYRVLRTEGTEIAFTGKYWNEHRAGTYVCAACGLELFRSAQKYDSGTGWPSFWAPSDKKYVARGNDTSVDGSGDEVECARCGGHLGHVFMDGPPPTGLRYCINSVSLKFVPANAKAAATAKR